MLSLVHFLETVTVLDYGPAVDLFSKKSKLLGKAEPSYWVSDPLNDIHVATVFIKGNYIPVLDIWWLHVRVPVVYCMGMKLTVLYFISGELLRYTSCACMSPLKGVVD